MINRILYLMKASCVKAAKLCSDLDISASSITDWKKGKGSPSIEAAVKISRYFNVTLDWLIIGEENHVTISTDDCELLNVYHKLNSIGKADLKGYSKGLLTNKEYADVSQHDTAFPAVSESKESK